MKYLAYSFLTIVAIILDQISKRMILSHFSCGERLNIIPDFFDLTLVFNPGAAFSFLADMGGIQKYIFTILAFAISGYLAYLVKKGELGKLGNWAVACIIGGAMGNVIDRFEYGHVVDFLLFYWQNHYYPAFNVADCFVCVGAALLLIDNMKHKSQAKTA